MDQKDMKNIARYKIVFIGDQAIGKTSIMIRFVYDNFSIAQQPTIGLDFISKIIKMNDRVIRLQLWDTAGQERFRSLIPSYIRDTKVAIVCYDVTRIVSYKCEVQESFNNVHKWLEFVREGGNEILTILVANKIDLVKERVVSSQEGQTFATQQDLRYFEVSAKEGTNVQQMFKNIAYWIVHPDKVDGTNEATIDTKANGLNLNEKREEQKQQQCAC